MISLVTPVALPIGTLSYFSLNNILTTPSYNNTYLFDVYVYGFATPTPITESWSDYLVVSPLVLSALTTNVVAYSKAKGRYTILTVTLTSTLPIPSAATQTVFTQQKGFLEFLFTGTSTNLGITGATSG